MKLLTFFALIAFCTCSFAQIKCQWNDKKVAFLGDSISDKAHIGTKKNYWQFLEETLGIKPVVYAINGSQFSGLTAQARLAKKDHPDIDAVIVFAGTNDFNRSVPIGEWFSYDYKKVQADDKTELRKHRNLVLDKSTLKGRINVLMTLLKSEFPDKQIIFLTPIHRSYAKFGEKNIQPDESYANALGLFIDDYVKAVKETANIWAVPVIDLNSLCGLYPNDPKHYQYFSNKDTDRLHPNAKGHQRMAMALTYALLQYPATFE